MPVCRVRVGNPARAGLPAGGHARSRKPGKVRAQLQGRPASHQNEHMSGVDFDRSSQQACAAVVRNLFPVAEEREAVMRQVLRSAAIADRIAPLAWGVTLQRHEIRLNVGQVEVFFANAGGFFINCAAAPDALPPTALRVREAGYSAIRHAQANVSGSLSEIAALLPEVQEAHARFIDIAARGPSSGKPRAGTQFRSSHSQGLMDYAQGAVNACNSGDVREDQALLEDMAAIATDTSVSETTRKALVEARLGQGKFREQLGERFDWRCAVTDLTIRPALRASHVVPWKLATNAERLDPDNGLLLAANLDALFDRALITFNQAGQLIVSPDISDAERSKLGPLGDLRVRPTPRQAAYLARHNELFKEEDARR